MSQPPFIPLPNRDASSTVRGFLYQVELTIKRWLEVDETTILELERGEDIDIIQQAWTSQETRTLEQIKLRSTSVSLRSPEVIEALVNFWFSHRANPALDLRFRYLTNAQTAVERDTDFDGGRAGVDVWNDYSAARLPAVDRGNFISKLRKFLLRLKRPDKVRPENWKLFRSFLRTDDPEMSRFAERVEWSCGSPQAAAIAADVEALLLQTGYLGQRDVTKAHSQLLSVVIRRIASPGVKRLTKEELRTELRDIEKATVNPALLGMINMLLQQDSQAHQLERNLLQAIGFAGQKIGGAESPQITPGLPSLISVIPAPVVGGTQRSETVAKLLQALKQTVWIGLYGDSGSGKTQLARLVSSQVAVPLWVSLRNISREQISDVFDNYIASLRKSSVKTNLRAWYTELCTHLSQGTMFFLDDLPFDGNADICAKTSILAECAAKTGIKIVSTAADKLSPTPGETLGTYFLEIPVPRFTDNEVKEYLVNQGAPDSLLMGPRFFTILDSVTRRHPQIISAFSRYMRANDWNYDEMTIRGVLRGDFAEDLRIQTRRILTATVPEASRELLYRLNVIGPVITNNDAASVGKLLPPISLPIDKLSECVGVWVQRFTSDAFIISPLVEQIGSADIPADMQKIIHVEKGRSILLKKRLNQFDSLAAIRHFIAAGENKEAAQVLYVALSALNEVDARNIEDFGLLDVWANTDFPTDIPLSIQLVIRALQISAKKKHAKKFSNLLARFDRLLENASGPEPLAAFGACVMLTMTLADSDFMLGVRYAMYALHLEQNLKSSLPKELEQHIGDFIWATTPYLREPDDLIFMLNSIAQLSPDQIRRIFESHMAAQSCRFVLDKFWTQEADKQSPQWLALLDRLVEIESAAQKLGAAVLVAAVNRARIVIAADYQKDLAKALELAERTSDQLKNDIRAVFLIAFTAGVSSCDANNWSQAIKWLSRAIELNEYVYKDLYVRALLSRAQARNKIGSSARDDCALAIQFCRTHEEISELMLIRSLGEYSICLWEEGNEAGFFQVWQETIERLLAGKADTNDWKEVFVLSGNNTGWFAANEKGVVPISNMTRPFQGMYLWYTPRLSSLYAPETEWYMPASMVWIAEKLGHYAESSQWALRATELAAGSPLGAQANIVLMYAGPQSIRQQRYTEALGFVSQAIEARQAPTDALSAFAEERGNEEFKRIIDERPRPKPGLGTEFVTVMMVPVLIDILARYMTDNSAGRDVVSSVIATCKELAENGDQSDIWITAHDALDQIFSPTTNLESIITAARQHSKEDRYLPAAMFSLGTATVGSPDAICINWLPALEFYERRFAASRLHIQLVTELVNKYWKLLAEASPFAFRQPSLLRAKLEEFEHRQDLLPRHVMRVVVWHLGLAVAAGAKQWLESV